MKYDWLIVLCTFLCLWSCSTSQVPQMTSMTFHGTLMMDQQPIRVVEYREFLHHQPAANRRLLLPADEAARFFLNDVNHLERPVWGLNGEQALAYCRWRSQVWNQKGDGFRYRFRLPTVTELRESTCAFGDARIDRELARAKEGIVALGEGLEDPGIATARGSNVGFRCVAEVVPM